MKFLIEFIDSNLSVWNSKLNELEENYFIMFEVKPYSNFRINIDDNYVLCSDEYYKKYKTKLINKKNVSCSVTILGSKPINQEHQLLNSLGYGKFIDEELNLFIHLNSQVFFHLCNQISSMKKINDLFITFRTGPELVRISPSNSENSNTIHWDRSQKKDESLLEIKSFEFGCNLYQIKDLN
jgi:hypothetical protein